jgi:hypothetical protein
LAQNNAANGGVEPGFERECGIAAAGCRYRKKIRRQRNKIISGAAELKCPPDFTNSIAATTLDFTVIDTGAVQTISFATPPGDESWRRLYTIGRLSWSIEHS